MSYQVLARRWRPITFEAVVGQDAIVRTLRNALARQRVAHAYLFAGPRGVGKTTTARLLAMGLLCEGPRDPGPVPCAACVPCREVIAGRALDVIEIDGASNRGIDEVRTLRENARYAPSRGRFKVYIVDEVHMLTEPAFNALLKTLEEPPAHVVFVLATTEARRLPATILSRCQRFDFRPIAATEIAAALRRILAEDAPGGAAAGAVEPEALLLVARAAEGSLRDALSLLDTALAYGEGTVDPAVVQALLGSGGAEAAWGLAEALCRRAAGEALERVARAAADGLDLGVLCRETLELGRQALLVRLLPAPPPELTADEVARLRTLGPAGGEGVEELLLLVKGLLDAEGEMRRSPDPRVDLEIAAVRLCQRPAPEAIERVLERLEQAEARLRGYGPLQSGPPGPTQPDLLGGPPPPAVVAQAAPLRPAARPGTGPARGGPPAPGGGERGDRPPAAGPIAAPARPGPPAGLEAVWSEIVAEVTRQRPTLGHLLAGAVPVSEEGGRLVVSVPNGNAFTQDQLRSPASRDLLLGAARRVRPELRDVAVVTGALGPGGGGPAAEHPAVRAAMELFDGEISAVRPAGRRAERGGPAPGEGPPDAGEDA